MEVEARAQSLRISVSGLEVLSIGPDKLADEPGAYAGLKRHTGHVGFGKGTGVARFRKIEIKELKPGNGPQEKKQPLSSNTTQAGSMEVKESKSKDTPGGWVSLVNRKDLTGWKTHAAAPGDWRVEDGILIGRGPKVSHLYTERSDYEDFDELQSKTLPRESATAPKIINDEMKRLAGASSVVSIKENGSDMPADAVNDLQVSNTGDKYLAKVGGKGALEWTYRLDPSKTPKILDATFVTGPKQGQTALGSTRWRATPSRFAGPNRAGNGPPNSPPSPAASFS